MRPQLYMRRTDQLEARPIAGTDGGISPFLSPDDRWVAFWADGQLMKVPVAGGVPVTLCDAEMIFGASWGPEGTIVFSPSLGSGLLKVPADGGKPETLTTPDKAGEEASHRLPHCLADGKGVLFTIMREPYDLEPRVALLDLKTRTWRVVVEDGADGNTLAFVEDRPDTGADILLLDLPSRRVTAFLSSRANEADPTFSPDGRWLAYVSDESGSWEVYVRPFADAGGKWQISSEAGYEPLWGRNGRQLFYRRWSRQQQQAWAVDIRIVGEFSAGKPRLLFEGSGLQDGFPRVWDTSLDGQRFLMVKMEERKPAPLTEMVLVQNWFEELRRLAPVGGN